jgi:type II secretory pathway pseudopilin PulG
LFGVLFMLTAAACGGDGALSDVSLPTTSEGEAGAPAEEAPEEAAPPAEAPEEAPAEEAPAEPAPEESTDDGGVSGGTILLIVVLGALAVAAVLGITGMMSSRSRAKEAERSTQRSRVAEVVGGYRWVHDQGSMEVLRTSDPDQLRRAWQTNNARIVQLEGMTSGMALEAETPELTSAYDDLGRASAGLRAAIESDVSLRADPTAVARDDLVLQSAQTVQQRRLDLNTALTNPYLRV